MDEVSDPSYVRFSRGSPMILKLSISRFLKFREEFVEFDSYIVPESDLEEGA